MFASAAAALAIAAAVLAATGIVVPARASAAAPPRTHDAIGHWDAAKANPNRTVTVTGWTFDRDAPSRGQARITIDGHRHTVGTGVARPDLVSKYHTSKLAKSGFSWTSQRLGYGKHKICAIALNRGKLGHNSPLGCRTIAIVDPDNPIGSGSFSKTAHTVRWSGRAVDPNVKTARLTVQYLIDGKVKQTVNAPVYPASFARTWKVGKDFGYGSHTISIRARNIGPGSANPIIGTLKFTFAPPWTERNQKVVAFAKAQLGKPYGFAGIGPAYFDCSGLAYASYLRIGIKLPRTAQGQFVAMRKISRAKAAPGDLAFLHEPGGYVYHVAVVSSAPAQNLIINAVTYGVGVRQEYNRYAVGSLTTGGRPGGGVYVTYGTLTH
ncbi:MAG: C40 family peptidase [Actinomycetia bacterium]|nr:C40 family peptidase [Actinomycetes bacterium]